MQSNGSIYAWQTLVTEFIMSNPTKTIRFSSLLACSTLLVAALWAANSLAAKAGAVIAIKGDAVANIGADTRVLAKNADIFEGDTIRTGDGSYVVVKFIDGAKATIRPGSQLTVERYRADVGNEDVLLNLVKGGLRAVTGGIAKRNPESYNVKTPTATLGVRGTEFYVRICEDLCPEEPQVQGQELVAQ